MKKNGQYVGVDEKYIPKEEKYVDDEANEEIKNSINDGILSAKDYITDKDNQEKFKKAGKKGVKILKGIGIGYLAVISFIIIVFITIFFIAISNFIQNKKRVDDFNDIYNQTLETIKNQQNELK